MAGRALTLPTGWQCATETRARVRGRCAEHGLTVAKGYGELGSTCIRIGHMGDRSLAELDGLLDVLTGGWFSRQTSGAG